MKENKAILLLLLTSFIWGFSFVAQSVSTESIGTFAFTGIRMLLGALVLVPFALKDLKSHSKDRAYIKSTILGGLFMGIALSLATTTQQIGIITTDAGKAAFITSIYMILVPFISRLFGKKIEKKIWLCAIIALIGMYLLCLSGGMSLREGDIYLILCAFFFSFHILITEKVAKDLSGVTLSFFQFIFGGLICLIVMAFTEEISLSIIRASLIPLLYSGVCSCGIAYTLQTVGQKYVQASKATLALSLESVWAAIGGALMLGERLSSAELLGSALVFLAVLFAQLDIKFNTSSR